MTRTQHLPAKSGVSIVIPCLNEERTVGQAVDQALAALAALGGEGEVLVIDNGSSDCSAAIARAKGARVVEVRERGYGATLRAGFHAAGFESIAIADADLSYPLLEFPILLAKLNDGADFVLGNRLRGSLNPKAMPWPNRYLGTPVLSFCLRIFFSIPTYDCNSGMRVFRRSQVLAMNLRSNGMELASEMLVRAAQMRLRYVEVTISFYPDGRGRGPHLNRWRDGWRHLSLIVGSRYASRRI